jgi:hypothetical protein
MNDGASEPGPIGSGEMAARGTAMMFDDSTYRIHPQKSLRREADRLLPQSLPPVFPAWRRICARPLERLAVVAALVAHRS